MLDALHRFGPLSMALAGVAIGFYSSMVFGAFASYPHFPSVPGWDQYPEPVALTQEKILFNGVLALAVLAGVGITLVSVQRSALSAVLKALLRISTVSLAAWVVVYSWRLTGRDAIGTEAEVTNTWLWVMFVAGLVVLWVGLLAGAVDLGIRRELLLLRGRSVTPTVPRRILTGRLLVVGGLMMWMWLSPWRTTDRLELSVITTAGCAIWLWKQPAQSEHDADRIDHAPR